MVTLTSEGLPRPGEGRSSGLLARVRSLARRAAAGKRANFRQKSGPFHILIIRFMGAWILDGIKGVAFMNESSSAWTVLPPPGFSTRAWKTGEDGGVP